MRSFSNTGTPKRSGSVTSFSITIAPFSSCSKVVGSLANVAFNDVVAQHDADFVALGPGLGQPQRIGDAGFSFLIGEAELLQAELLAVLQQAQKIAGVVPAGDDQDVANAGIHQRLQRIEDHGLVIHRQQVLVGDTSQWIQTRADAARQDYALHRSPFLCREQRGRTTESLPALPLKLLRKHVAGARNEMNRFGNR